MMQFLDKFHKIIYRSREKSPYASLSDRLFAASVDLLLIYFAVAQIGLYVTTMMYPEGNAISAALALTAQENPELAKSGNSAELFRIAAGTHADLIQLGMKQFLTSSMTQFLLMGFLIIPLTKIKGASLGKMLLGLRVVDSITGGEISWWQAVIRYLGYLPSCVFFMIGIFWAGTNKRKRTWHDYLADTVVIYDPKSWHKKLGQKLRAWLFGEKK